MLPWEAMAEIAFDFSKEAVIPARFRVINSPECSKSGNAISDKIIVTKPSLFLFDTLFKIVSTSHASELPNE